MEEEKRKRIADYIRWHADREEEKNRRLHPDAFACMIAEKLRDLAGRIERAEEETTKWT